MYDMGTCWIGHWQTLGLADEVAADAVDECVVDFDADDDVDDGIVAMATVSDAAICDLPLLLRLDPLDAVFS